MKDKFFKIFELLGENTNLQLKFRSSVDHFSVYFVVEQKGFTAIYPVEKYAEEEFIKVLEDIACSFHLSEQCCNPRNYEI